MKSKKQFDEILVKCQDGLPYHIKVYEQVSLNGDEIVTVDYAKSKKYQTDRFKHYSPTKPISKMLSLKESPKT